MDRMRDQDLTDAQFEAGLTSLPEYQQLEKLYGNIGGAETSSGISYFRHGRFRTTGTHYPPIIIKAIALPATIITGE